MNLNIMENKKFTILTSNYDASKYLRDWADSILYQNYRPLEVIFVEDHSKDNSLKIIKEISKDFCKKNIDFKLVQHPSKLFCGSAYNVALSHASGEYFGILDSDDMLEPFACNFVASIYDKNLDVAWIYTQYNKYNRKMNRIIKRGFCKAPKKGKTILQMEGKHINTYGHWRTFSTRIKRDKNLFGKNLKCCVDKHLGFRLEEEGNGIFVDEVCYRYRTRSKKENSIVNKHDLKKNREEVVYAAKKRRKKKKIYSVSEYKGRM